MTFAVEVKDLERQYVSHTKLFGRGGKTIQALKGVSFDIPQAEVFGLLGPNGAGKTTTIKILTTLLAPSAGTARVLGHDVMRDTRALRQRINFIFGGERSLYWRLSARDNLQYFADLYKVPRAVQRTRIPELLEMVGLTQRAAERVETFSKGMKQRLHIARGMVNDPDVLFLDEPTIGLDPVAAQELRTLILGLKARGKTVLLTTHYMFEADQVCDRIAVIDGGQIVAMDTPANLKRLAVGLSVLELIATGISAEDVHQIRALPGVSAVTLKTLDQRHMLLVQAEEPRGCQEAVLRTLGHRQVSDVRVRDATLEDAYLKLVGGKG